MDRMLKIIAGIDGMVMAISACCVDSETIVPTIICVATTAVLGFLVHFIDWEA